MDEDFFLYTRSLLCKCFRWFFYCTKVNHRLYGPLFDGLSVTHTASAAALQQPQWRVVQVWMSLTGSNPHAWVHPYQTHPAAAGTHVQKGAAGCRLSREAVVC